jgi:predicted amidohydrolase
MARYVTVAAVSERPSADYDAIHDRAAMFVERAKRLGAQIIAFPECHPHTALPGRAYDKAEPLDGRSLAFMGQQARQHGMHVIWPLYTLEEAKAYNSAVLLDPTGKVAGVYHKMFPVDTEMTEAGLTPGDGPRVFDTDLGRLGMVICFDLNFPEIMQGTGDAGAEIIFFCSAYRGGLQTRIWAYLLGTYIVSAIRDGQGYIVDLSGQVLGEATYEALITRRLNLDRKLMHMDNNWEKMDAMLAKYGPHLSVDFFTPEGCWALGSESDAFTVDDVIREFALELRTDYFNRARRVREQALP